MALAYHEEDEAIEKKLNKMLRDSRNRDYQARIYYALGYIEEKHGREDKAVDFYWKSVHASVDNENQQVLSFRKLGDYYFRERAYMQAQSCYDSCMYMMDSRYEDYDRQKVVLGDLTSLTQCLSTIQLQDSVLALAALPEAERNRVIDSKIEEVKAREEALREQERQAQDDRNFYERNNSGGITSYSNEQVTGNWYFYNPVTIALGKNDFKRKWGRRKLEDNWSRKN